MRTIVRICNTFVTYSFVALDSNFILIVVIIIIIIIIIIIDPFSERAWRIGKQKGSHKSYLPCQNWWKFYQQYQVTLKSLNIVSRKLR